MFVEILIVSVVWLGAFVAIGYALAIWFASHVSGFFLEIGLLFGAFGAVGEIGYLLVERNWGQMRIPRWLLVGAWTTIAPTIAYAAMEIARQHTGIIEGVVLVVIGCVLPVFVTAYVASWPFRSRSNRFSSVS